MELAAAAPEYFARYRSGSEIFREGEIGAEMYLIQQGQVEICKLLRGEERRLAVLEQGDFFGEMAILEDLPRSASARALGDCVLIRMDRQTFNKMARQNPEIPVRMLRKLCHRLRETDPLLLDVDARAAKIAGHHYDEEYDEEPPTDKVRLDAVLASHAVLAHVSSGVELPLAPGPEISIGRHDAAAGISPDIDLRELDFQHSISRRHAKIIRRDGAFLLREEVGTTNGTFLNGTRIVTGQDYLLDDGDQIRFGLIATRFHIRK